MQEGCKVVSATKQCHWSAKAANARLSLILQGVLEEVALLQEITEACRSCVRAFVEDRTDAQGRVSLDSLNNFARSLGFGQQPWMKALKVRLTDTLLRLAKGVHNHKADTGRRCSGLPLASNPKLKICCGT